MADVRDFMEASSQTDSALRDLEHASAGEPEMATLLGARAIALAIREVGCRLDYVLRDLHADHRATYRG